MTETNRVVPDQTPQSATSDQVPSSLHNYTAYAVKILTINKQDIPKHDLSYRHRFLDYLISNLHVDEAGSSEFKSCSPVQ